MKLFWPCHPQIKKPQFLPMTLPIPRKKIALLAYRLIFVPRLTKWGRGTIEFAIVCPSVRSLFWPCHPQIKKPQFLPMTLPIPRKEIALVAYWLIFVPRLTKWGNYWIRHRLSVCLFASNNSKSFCQNLISTQSFYLIEKNLTYFKPGKHVNYVLMVKSRSFPTLRHFHSCTMYIYVHSLLRVHCTSKNTPMTFLISARSVI